MGRRLGCPQATVQLWESGKTTPDTENLAKIASVLGLQLSELFRLIEQETVLSGAPSSLDLAKIIDALDSMAPGDVAKIVSAGAQKLAQVN